MSLDLDSQVQLLSRIQFLTRFSSNLIPITGGEGAGKTWLAQRYLENWADASQQVLMLCHPSQSDAQHRAIILQQLAPNAVFNEHDPLLQSIERILGQYPVQLLLVVDDAHLLSPAIIAELWALVQKGQAEPDWQVNVLLFSHTGRLDKYLESTSHGQGQLPLEVEIPPLAEQEVQTFVETMFAAEPLDAQGRRLLRERASKVAPKPGELVKLEQGEHQDMANQTSRKPSPLVVMAVLLVIAVAAIVGWLYPSATNEVAGGVGQAQLDEALAEVDVTGTMDLSSNLAEEEQASPVEPEETASAGAVDTSADDSHNLPPEVSIEGLTVGRSETNQRVVVPSDVVDAMISEQDLGGSGEEAVVDMRDTLQPVLPEGGASEQPQAGGETNTVDAEPSTDTTPSQTSSTAVQPAPQTSVPASVLGEALTSVDANHYALQLAAMKSLDAASKFIDDYDIDSLASVYETRRNGVPWFIIVTGDYPNVVAARRAETQLPQRIQALQPWVKSYRQIHTEIERVK
ncbi:AAA family ATPase [Photobacterium sanctipauli]|nr:AAA family ATPase [Photobacterium sanctipauli]